MHTETHPLAGQTVTIKSGAYRGAELLVEDWWDKLTGSSWQMQGGNWACVDYVARVLLGSAKNDDEVLYGKIKDPNGGPVMLGKLIHISELEADTFAKRWEEFRRIMLPNDTPEAAVAAMKDAFYAGGANTLLMTFDTLEPGDKVLRPSNDAAGVIAEIISFAESAADESPQP